ncbi:hypothetical protein [Actinomadura litoris]|uniref:hypothetical protein n=1 Tax=Actinomadura litoris TaxID=2678616 RepID=UPI0015633AC8|nr:hypothetical protein [Actinomadura litoris]
MRTGPIPTGTDAAAAGFAVGRPASPAPDGARAGIFVLAGSPTVPGLTSRTPARFDGPSFGAPAWGEPSSGYRCWNRYGWAAAGVCA